MTLRRSISTLTIGAAMSCLVSVIGGKAEAQFSGGCMVEPPTIRQLTSAAAMSMRLRDYLENSGAELAIIARVGSDQSDRGLKYTHAGLVWRDHPKGRWIVAQELNACGTGRSDIYDQGLMQFFLDDPLNYDAEVIVPTEDLRRSLVAVLKNGDGLRVHEPSYSVISYPRSTMYQNSNEWVLEVIAMAQGRLRGQTILNRADAQKMHEALGFRGSKVEVSFFEQLFGGLFKPNLSFSDHPYEAFSDGWFEFVSVRSIREYLARQSQVASARDLIAR